jgi:hypothetical protein
VTRQTITVGGDSQTTDETSYGVLPRDTWGGCLSRTLRAEGRDVQVRAFGVSGDTTANLLDRLASMLLYDTPAIAGLMIGVNDPGASIAQATTQLNIEAAVMALKHGAKGDGLDSGVYVAGQANLPAVGGGIGQRMVVLNDTSATGGAAAWHSSQLATVAGAGPGGPTVWEWREPVPGENGWGRIAVRTTPPTVVPRVFVVSANYLNWTTGGDSLAVPYATYAPVRAAQAAAAAAQNVDVAGVASVAFVDLYTFQRARIVAGTDLDFKATAYDQTRSAHVADTNQHHSIYGHALVAQAVRAGVPAAWINALPEVA